MPSSPDPYSLTTHNLHRHTFQETPRTKVLRYFNNVEDPILQTREPTPQPWDLTRDFIPPGPIESPILGRDVLRQISLDIPVHPVFNSEDSDILAHNTNIPNIPIPANHRASNSEYDGSPHSVLNPYGKRPRRKMVQDPITGETNLNTKKSKKKISRPDSFVDLRLLDQFHSKLIAKDRITIESNAGKHYGVVKDLEFPRLTELGRKRKERDKVEEVREKKRITDGRAQISDYFKSATKDTERYTTNLNSNAANTDTMVANITVQEKESVSVNEHPPATSDAMDIAKPPDIVAPDNTESVYIQPLEDKIPPSDLQIRPLAESQNQSISSPKIYNKCLHHPAEPSSHNILLEKYSTLAPLLPSPPRLVRRRNLIDLIDACNSALEPPVRIPEIIPETPVMSDKSQYTGYCQSPGEPIDTSGGDTVQYVRGAPRKHKTVWKAGKHRTGNLTISQASWKYRSRDEGNTTRLTGDNLQATLAIWMNNMPPNGGPNVNTATGNTLPPATKYKRASRPVPAQIRQTEEDRSYILTEEVIPGHNNLRNQLTAMEHACLDEAEALYSDDDFDKIIDNYYGEDDDGKDGILDKVGESRDRDEIPVDEKLWWKTHRMRF